MSRKVAEAAEEGKSAQYQGLPPGHCFTLVAIKFGSNWSKVTGLLIIIIIIVKSLGYWVYTLGNVMEIVWWYS